MGAWALSSIGARALSTVGARALSTLGARPLSPVGARALRTVGARQARAQIDPKWCSSTSPCALVEKKCPFFLEPNFFFHSSIFLEYKLVSLSSISPNVFWYLRGYLFEFLWEFRPDMLRGIDVEYVFYAYAPGCSQAPAAPLPPHPPHQCCAQGHTGADYVFTDLQHQTNR